jgi:membrane-bound ClpP family serine protease
MELFQDFAAWTLATKIYFGISVFATVALLIQIVMLMFGFGDTGAADFGADAHIDAGCLSHGAGEHPLSGMAGITYFSLSSITAFLCFFGWVGFVLMRSNVWALPTFVAALACGLIAFFIVAYVLSLFRRMNSSGNVELRDAVGEIGTVYVTIPAGEGEAGAVNVSIGGRQREYRAISEDGKTIKTGKRVKVSAMLDTRTLVVTSVNVPSEWMEKGL